MESGGGGFTDADVEVTTDTTTVDDVDRQVNANLPRRTRRAASAGVAQVMLSLESPQARAQREAREAAQEAAAQAQRDADREAAREAALEEAARAQASCPPLSYSAWHSSIDKNLSKGYKYFLDRIKEGGDQHNLVEFYDGARIFNPYYAKNLSDQDAFALIEKLGNYPALRVGGDSSIITRLKKSWKTYKEEAVLVETDFGKDFKIEKV
eukprot:scaffold79196_cov36-Cyclotella_meneghiniana.AAC.5